MAVNLQTASVEDLKSIHGVGDAIAGRIVTEREQQTLTFENLVKCSKKGADFWDPLFKDKVVFLEVPIQSIDEREKQLALVTQKLHLREQEVEQDHLN